MKTLIRYSVATSLFCGLALAQETVSYTNYLRQYQTSGVIWDASDTVAAAGFQPSKLAINPQGARFELSTLKSSSTTGLTSYPLDSAYVGTYVPVAYMTVRSEDTTGVVPRTRADRPFWVDITMEGILNGATDPAASKSVKFLRHVQSYGVGGDGSNLDRTQATLLTQNSISTNGLLPLTYPINSIPGGDRSKVRGEERFSIFSLEDNRDGYKAPEMQIATQILQVWPVADGAITGLTQDQLIRFSLPTVTLALNDLYPFSTTYAQVYKGSPALGTTGTIVPGSALVISASVSQSRVLSLTNYDSVLDTDGRWTMEVVTVTPFGIDRLAYVSFILDRKIDVVGSIITVE